MSDSEDEDFRKAIALSLGQEYVPQSALPCANDQGTKVNAVSTTTRPATSSGLAGLAGLDRKAMEQERLARRNGLNGLNGKRARDDISPPPSRATKVARLKDSEPPSSSAPGRLQESPNSNRSSNLRVQAQQISAPSRLSYPYGKLYRTWAFGHQRDGKDIKFEEVLERGTLKTAVLSAYTFDWDWLFTKIDSKNTTYHFVVSSEEQAIDLNSLEAANVKAYKPAYGKLMHSKLMILVHPTKLRVVIPSANLVGYDWGETGIMENTVWLIDLPRRSPDSDFVSTPFLDELKYFLEKQSLPQTVLSGLERFDWSATGPYAFVHSVGGISYSTSAARTGLTGLSSAVRQLGLTSTKTQVDMCASSVGALTDAKLSNLHAAARGDFNIPFSASGRATIFPQSATVDIKSSFRLYFPTHDYVASSPRGGVDNGGTIWFNRNHYEKPTFPKSAFREFKSTRGHLLSHCKMLFVRGVSTPASDPANGTSKLFKKKSDTPNAEQVAYVYAGSANCSDAAWGTLVAEKKAGPNKGQLHMTCNNWECGVLIPILGPNVKELYAEAKYKAGQTLAESKPNKISVDKINNQKDEDETASENETESEDDAEDERKNKTPKGQSTSHNKIETSKRGGKKACPQLKEKRPTQSRVDLPDWNVFKSVIDGPFQYPAKEYGAGQQPWYVRER